MDAFGDARRDRGAVLDVPARGVGGQARLGSLGGPQLEFIELELIELEFIELELVQLELVQLELVQLGLVQLELVGLVR